MKNNVRIDNLPVNHKGQNCIVDVKTPTCQESYCSGCEKYRVYLLNPKGSQK